MANTLVWESAGAGYSVSTAPRRPARRRARVSPVASAPRRSRRRPIAWKLLATRLGEILAVALWAALIPAAMWLGTAAGF